MARAKLTELPIDDALFSMAFDRDVDYHDPHPQSAYLDKKCGDILWVFENDKDAELEVGIAAADNEAQRSRIDAAPERFLQIPGRTHGQHHDLLRQFLSSKWTTDESLRKQAQAAYFRSIGGWIKAVDDETIRAFYDFRDKRLREMAEDFLKEQGVEPDWK